MKLNSNYSKLKDSYLFAKISEKTKEYSKKNPDKKLIQLGIGDVTFPLCNEIVKNLHSAVDEMANIETFKGYGPYEGYFFLRELISNQFKKFGAEINPSEVFINDGAKSDCANILNIFSNNLKVLIQNPTYPVYLDSNITAGNNVSFLDANEANDFLPMPDFSVDADLIYLCSPNNPTGATYSKDQLKTWVEYANEKKAIIIFDAAYNAFISSNELPRTIFEIENSKTCAIEINSFSKTAGFTGLRCGFTIIPNELEIDGQSVNKLWFRHQSTNFNGVSYITQKGAAACFSEKGQQEINTIINQYLENSKILSKTLTELNVFNIGGKNSPYVWFKCFNNLNSWDFFDFLLNNFQIVGTPGCGFGKNGEGYFRFSAFGKKEEILKATEKLKSLF